MRTPKERVWLAAWIGDWPAAHEAAVASGDDRLVTLTASCAEETRQRWLKRLRNRLEKRGLCGDLLVALAEAGDKDLSEHVTKALASEEAVSSALDIIADDFLLGRVFSSSGRQLALCCSLSRWLPLR